MLLLPEEHKTVKVWRILGCIGVAIAIVSISYVGSQLGNVSKLTLANKDLAELNLVLKDERDGLNFAVGQGCIAYRPYQFVMAMPTDKGIRCVQVQIPGISDE